DALGALLGAIDALSKQVAEIRAGQLEGAAAKDAGGKEAGAAEPGGDKIQALIDELEAGSPAKEPEGPEEGGGQEEALTVPASRDGAAADSPAADSAPAPAPARDEAVRLLRRARPALAAIKDDGERSRVTDALVGAVRDEAGTPYARTLDAAEARAQAPRYSVIEAQQAAYDRLNPHKNKKGA
ncbi:MAG: hypothetical protein LBJ10_03055, partial [Clostridiales bacterium]|nr:hypothetical protein [Clostridiales bacterium]